MQISICKFGGTALATPSDQMRAVQFIRKMPGKVLCVCSAMGRSGFAYSTANLEALVEPKLLLPSETDRLLACGEIISCARMSYVLKKSGICAYALSLAETGITCTDQFGDADIVRTDPEKILRLFRTYDVLIAPGYIGRTQNGETATLGKGNSDLTAVCLAQALHQKEATLYKNVDGVFHTPPQVYQQLMKYDQIGYGQMIALAEIGFGIVSVKALQAAQKHGILIRVRSYLNEETEGTVISQAEADDLMLGFNFLEKRVSVASFFPCRIKELLEPELQKNHIFVRNEEIHETCYSFEINKSVRSIVRSILIGFLEKQN